MITLHNALQWVLFFLSILIILINVAFFFLCSWTGDKIKNIGKPLIVKFHECSCFIPVILNTASVFYWTGDKSRRGLCPPVHELHECDFCCPEAGKVLILSFLFCLLLVTCIFIYLFLNVFVFVF